jgi:hypothetical protein
MIIILVKSHAKEQSNSRFEKNHTIRRFQIIKYQLLKHKHILIGPLLLAILSIPRTTFLFIFVCTKLDQRPYVSLFAYLIAFIPSMSILFAFILPSQNYRSALFLRIKRMVPNRVQNWLTKHNISFFEQSVT